jgi:hypothetical protein
MTFSIAFVVVILALLCFALRVCGVSSRVDLVALGLFLWLLSQVVR